MRKDDGVGHFFFAFAGEASIRSWRSACLTPTVDIAFLQLSTSAPMNSFAVDGRRGWSRWLQERICEMCREADADHGHNVWVVVLSADMTWAMI